MDRSTSEWGREEKWGLWGLLVFTLAAVVGYGMYGLRPQNLPDSEFGLRFFSISFIFFARLHIVLAAVALGVVLHRRIKWSWFHAFFAVFALSFTAEHLGTGYGVPFGGYSYTSLLGPRLGERVPFLIPISWFLMALPSWIMARVAFRGRDGALGRVALGSLWLVIWDLALDPAMSFLTTYWRWEESGPYYGMPWMNLVGWYVTGLVLMVAIERLSRRSSWDALDARYMAVYYGLMVLMPLGMLVAAAEWLGVAVTLGAIAGASWFTFERARRAAGDTRGSLHVDTVVEDAVREVVRI